MARTADMIEFHPAANIFPLDDEHLDELAEDIRTNGLLVPIELFGGKIIDGRRRYLACRQAEVEPDLMDVEPEDLVAYVLSLNLQRRHLDESQKAMVGDRAEAMRDKLEKEAKARRVRKPKSVPVNLPEQNRGDTRDKLGEMVGVSGKMIDFARKVRTKGVRELAKAVDNGQLAVSKAAKIADLPTETQKRAVKALKEGGRSAMNKALQPKGKPKTYPLSDQFDHWLGGICGGMVGLRLENDGIKKRFTDPGWDRRRNKEFVESLKRLCRDLARFTKEVETYVNKSGS